MFFYADDFEHGWPAYEARFSKAGAEIAAALEVREPLATTNRWDGRVDPNGTLYIWAEQGFGDQLMMMPWVQAAVNRYQGRVLMYVPKPLSRLMANLIPEDRQLADISAIPVGAVNCPILSLPVALGDTTRPSPRARFVTVPEQVRGKFSERIEALSGLRVGLCWSGAKGHAEDRWRSVALRVLAPLASVSGASFVSLQRDANPLEIADFPAPLADWTGDITDFADSAALIDQLDLLISVDSAPAHLAGGLGKPVWLLSRYSGEWRWGRARNGHNHWYQSLRLFSQPKRDDWASVVDRMAAELRLLVDINKIDQ